MCIWWCMRGESSVAPTHSDLSVFVLRYRNRAIQTFLLRVAFFCMISYTYGIFEKKRLKISSNSIWLLMTLTIRISPTEWENGVEWTQRDYYRGYNPHCVTLLLFSAAKNARHRKKEHSEVSDRVYSETSVVRILKIHEKQSVGRHSQKQ